MIKAFDRNYLFRKNRKKDTFKFNFNFKTVYERKVYKKNYKITNTIKNKILGTLLNFNTDSFEAHAEQRNVGANNRILIEHLIWMRMRPTLIFAAVLLFSCIALMGV